MVKNLPEIKLTGLTKKISKNNILENVSFEIKGYGITGYLGPNGAGKTTTLKILTNLIRPDSGQALINGIDSRDYKKTLRYVSALVDVPEPYPDMTVKEFLSFIGGLRGVKKDILDSRINSLKKELSLEDLNRKCGELSKGNKQRVVIAAVLLPDTDIILLDEPTSGLDPAESHDIKELLKKLKKRKLILLSSHLMDEVKELCNYLILIDKGKIIATGPIKQIIKKFGKGRGEKGLESAYLNIVGRNHG
ncbi:MAG: ABC transporter ATP-binding protein [Candidatus Parvarchaeota archaeon]|jgi:ABC-2 type transport system ATP-binding protein|nr:ABC transporter ATP-binding protein [Candidatus Parvarchaeota archaeon]MCL5420168.1 ABC transporter ATP-binding protein [Candidatus Parvarchaeota archaeon]